MWVVLKPFLESLREYDIYVTQNLQQHNIWSMPLHTRIIVQWYNAPLTTIRDILQPPPPPHFLYSPLLFATRCNIFKMQWTNKITHTAFTLAQKWENFDPILVLQIPNPKSVLPSSFTAKVCTCLGAFCLTLSTGELFGSPRLSSHNFPFFPIARIRSSCFCCCSYRKRLDERLKVRFKSWHFNITFKEIIPTTWYFWSFFNNIMVKFLIESCSYYKCIAK